MTGDRRREKLRGKLDQANLGTGGTLTASILDRKNFKDNIIPLVNSKAEYLLRVILGAAQTKTEKDRHLGDSSK